MPATKKAASKSGTKKPGLYANIQAKRERIAHGSGERMRKPGSDGAPSADAFEKAARTGSAKKAARKTTTKKVAAKKTAAKKTTAKKTAAKKAAAKKAPAKKAASKKAVGAKRGVARKAAPARKTGTARQDWRRIAVDGEHRASRLPTCFRSDRGVPGIGSYQSGRAAQRLDRATPFSLAIITGRVGRAAVR